MPIAIAKAMTRRAPRLPPLMLLLAAACAPQLASYPQPFDPRSYRPALESNGELHLYLQPFPAEAGGLHLRIGDVSVIRPDGGFEPLLESPADLEGSERISMQKRLGSAALAPGAYKGLSIQIVTASVTGDQGTIDLLVPGEPVVVEQEFTVSRGEASALFLSLGGETMAGVTSRLTPIFSLAGPTRQLSSMLGFATVPARNVVPVFNKHSMQVVDVIATWSGPTDAALDPRKGSVFVSAAGDHAVEILDARTSQGLGHIRLAVGDEPREIVLSPDARTLVSANYGSSTASILDTAARREVVRLPLPSRPTDIVADRTRPRAYVVLPRSRSVSAIDLRRRGLAGTVSLEETPIRAALSGDGATLYLITANSPNLLVLDAESLVLKARIYVGAGAVSIQVDPRTDSIYVGRRSGKIAVADPWALMPIDEFAVDGIPAFLTIDPEENALFVVLPDAGRIEKLDLVSKKVLGRLEVERGGYAMVIAGER